MSKGPSTQITPQLCVMPATAADRGYLIEAFTRALAPYYEGNHLVHAERVLQTHLSGADNRGFFRRGNCFWCCGKAPNGGGFLILSSSGSQPAR
jgi:hypothetical protein